VYKENKLENVSNVATAARAKLFWIEMMLTNLNESVKLERQDIVGVIDYLDGIYMDLEPVENYLSNLIKEDAQ